ncbi:MAG: hypothetical protein RLY95_670 [Pseudomonadota bacterium]
MKIVMAAAAISIHAALLCELEFVMPSLSKLILLSIALVSVCTAHAQNLPPEVDAALTRARIPKDAISLYVIDANPSVSAPLLTHRASTPMNPASVMKLVTSVAALDLLGPAYTWQTQVLIDPAGKDGAIKDGVLHGDLIIKGGGDPKLVVERVWLLLNRIRSLGIQTINGNLVLDSSAFAVPAASAASAAAFDGEPTKPYNASPDALLINFKSLVMTFTVNTAAGVASIHYEPPLAGVTMPASTPLTNTDCSDYRSALKADFSDPKRIRFLGGFPRSCGERVWPIAYSDPAAFASLAMRGLWESLGGKLLGMARAGATPVQAKSLFAFSSLSLGEVIRDMNKFSNNVMAQQIFLSLSLSDNKPASFAASRSVFSSWWQMRYGGFVDAPTPIIDNGSGLSRDERVSALSLARMLQSAYAAPYMPELIASLPQTGVDGTLRRSKAAVGAAHLKTGSLNNVVARAGYVDGANGKRYVLIAMVNSDNGAVLAGARSVLDAVIDWTARQ